MRNLFLLAVLAFFSGGLPYPVAGSPGEPMPSTASVPTTSPQANRLIAESNAIDIRDGTKLKIGDWSLNSAANPDIYTAELNTGERREVCFISAQNSLCRTVGIGDQADFIITYQGKDYPTRIVGAYVRPAAKFDAAYQAANRGKVAVLIPEVYELVNVAIALTPYARDDKFLVMKDTQYYHDLQTHFAPVAGHPFVQWLDAEIRKDIFNYFIHKMNAYAFEYGRQDQIVRSLVYDRIETSSNTLLPQLAQMQSFSEQSKFRKFYLRQRPFYEEQIGLIRDEMNLDAMMAWLRREFPTVKPYDHAKVIFSPLVYANQSAQWFEEDGFTELQAHVNFPHPQMYKLPVTGRAKILERSNQLFGEINHGFINPTAEPYRRQIAAAVSNRDAWAVKGKSSDQYSAPQTLFNEYMNWIVTNLYWADQLPRAEADVLIAGNEKAMKERRGFTQFPEFSQFLVKLYRERPASTTIADLYPQIIAWFAAHNRQAATAPQPASSAKP